MTVWIIKNNEGKYWSEHRIKCWENYLEYAYIMSNEKLAESKIKEEFLTNCRPVPIEINEYGKEDTCTFIQRNTHSSYCTNCKNYIRHDNTSFYNTKQSKRTKFNFCPNCGSKIIERIRKEGSE